MAGDQVVTLRLTGESGQLVATLKTSKAALAELGTTATQTGNETERGMSRGTAAAKLYGSAVSSASGMLRQLALGAAAAVGIGGLTAIMSASVGVARDYGKAIAEVSTVAGDTSKMAGMAQAVRELSKEYGQAPAAQAKALYEIISAGITDTARATETLAQANRLALGGITEVETAADGLTTVLNAYGAAAGSAAEVSDRLFVAALAGKTTIGELSAAIGNAAPIAAQTGVSLDELLASVAALTLGGVKTTTAVDGIRATIAAIIKPSQEATQLAAQLGLQFDATALKSQGLAQFLDNVKTATGGSADKLAVLFGGVEALAPVMSLTGNQAQAFAATLDSMANSAGVTDEAVAKMSDTAAFKFARLKSVVGDSLLSIGESLLNVLAPAAEALADNWDSIGAGLNTIVSAAQTAAGALLLFAGVRGVVGAVTALQGLRQELAVGALVWKTWATATAFGATGADAFGARLVALAGGPVVVAGAALALLAVNVKNTWDEIIAAEQRGATSIARAQGSIGSGLAGRDRPLAAIETDVERLAALMQRDSGREQALDRHRTSLAALEAQYMKAGGTVETWNKLLDASTTEAISASEASTKQGAALKAIDKIAAEAGLASAKLAKENETYAAALHDLAFEEAKGGEAAKQAAAVRLELNAQHAQSVAQITGLTEATKANEEATHAAAKADDHRREALRRLAEQQQRAADNEYSGSQIDSESAAIAAGHMVDALRAESAQVGLTQAELRRLAETRQFDAEMQAAQLARSPEQLAAMRAEFEQAQTTRDAAEQAFEAAQRAAQDGQRAWTDFAGDLVDAMGHGMRGVKDLFANMLKDLARQLLQSSILRLMASVFGGSMPGLAAAAGVGGGQSMLGAMLGGNSGGLLSSFGNMLGIGTGSGGTLLGSISNMFGLGGASAGGGGAFAGASAGAAGASHLGVGGIGASAAGGGLITGTGMSTAFAGVPIIGWIAAAVSTNMSLVRQGWTAGGGNLLLPGGQNVRGGGLPAGFAAISPSAGVDMIFRALGMSSSTASLLSGAGIMTRLFGRQAPMLTGQTTTMQFGPGGVGGSELYRILERGGVFRSDRRSTRTGALSDEASSAAHDLYESVRRVMIDDARALKGEAPAMLESALRVVQEFDRKGKVKSTKYFVDILGRTWEEASADDAQLRLFSEARIATIDAILGTTVATASEAAANGAGDVIDAAAVGATGALDGAGRMFDGIIKTAGAAQGEASAIAERWRDDVNLLADGAAMLMAAAVDIRAGNGLLGDDGTLTQIADLVEELQGPGESLAATYTRIAKSTQLLEEALGLSGVSLDMTREELVRFAVDIANAAGGLDRAQQLWSAYFDNFYTQAERAQYALTQATANAAGQFGDIGLNLNDYTGGGGARAFRELFESVLPTLSAEAVVDWLEAAEALGIYIDAAAAAAGETASLADRIKAYTDFVAQFKPPAEIATGADATSVAAAQAAAAAWEQSMINQANTYAIAAGLEGAAAADLANIHTRAAGFVAEAAARLTQQYDDFVSQFRPDDALPTGANAGTMDEARAQVAAWEAAMIEQANTYAIAAGLEGAAAADLANIHARAADLIAEAQARIDAAMERYQDLVRGVRDQLDEERGMSEFSRQMRDIDRGLADTIEAMNEAARAAGMQGAAESDLAAAHELAARRAARAIAQLMERARSVVAQLYGPDAQRVPAGTALGGGGGSQTTPVGTAGATAAKSSAIVATDVAELTAGVYALSDGIDDWVDTSQDGIDSVNDATTEMYQAQVAAQQHIRDWLDNLLIGDLGGLRPRDALAEAQTLFNTTLAAALGGDADAMDALPQLADQLLRLGQQVYASGDPYFELRDSIVSALQQVAGLQFTDPGTAGGGGGGRGGGGGGGSQTPPDDIAQILRERQELANELVGYINDLISATGRPLTAIATNLGVNMGDLVRDLGVNLQSLNVGTGTQLADIAREMGVNLTDLASAVGVDLGSLADAQSIMNDALEAAIGTLPPEQAAALQPLLQNIEQAAARGDTAGVEAGIDAMTRRIADMGYDVSNRLAPFFTAVTTATGSQSTLMASVATSSQTMATSLNTAVGILRTIATNTGPASPLPSYAVGTDWVPNDGLAYLHAGEAVVPRNVNTRLRGVGASQIINPIPVVQIGGLASNGPRDDAVVAELRRDREASDRLVLQLLGQIGRLETVVREGARVNAAAVDRQTDALKSTRSK